MTRMINNPQTQGRKKLVKKFVKDVEISTREVRGKFSITGYRKYPHHCEVDVEFQGEIFVRFQRKLDWFKLDYLVNNRASVIKVNRLVRKKIFPEIRFNLLVFSVNIHHYTDIKKLKYT